MYINSKLTEYYNNGYVLAERTFFFWNDWGLKNIQSCIFTKPDKCKIPHQKTTKRIEIDIILIPAGESYVAFESENRSTTTQSVPPNKLLKRSIYIHTLKYCKII